jgi:hypothetical protein
MKLAKLWGMKGNSRKGWGRDPIPGSAGAPFRFQHLIPPAPQVTGRSAYKAYVSSYSIPLFPSTNGHKWELQGSYRRMGVTCYRRVGVTGAQGSYRRMGVTGALRRNTTVQARKPAR